MHPPPPVNTDLLEKTQTKVLITYSFPSSLIAPKYPLVGDRLMSYQFYNLPTTKINISLHILEDKSW